MAEVAKKVNYTDTDMSVLTNMYGELGNDGLDRIAETLNKTVRSVRAKLVREGLYVAPEKGAAKAKKEGPTKKELLNDLEKIAPFPVDGLVGATKEAISHLIATFTARKDA
jgi:hypothetical protein